MSLYRKRPIVVKAEQWKSFNAWARSLGVCDCHGDFYHPADPTLIQEGLHVHTLEGVVPTQPGDWIVTGILNEKWPIKNEVFKRTYEKVTKRGVHRQKDNA